MAISPYIRRLRGLVGHDLLLLPSVGVLPRDDEGRILLVKVMDSDQWAVIGGSIEPDESPEQAAVREAQEEAGVDLSLGPIVGVFGGPEFRLTYANGDQTAYVATIFAATVGGGTPTPDGDETSDVAWWSPDAFPHSAMSQFTLALLRAAGLGAGLPAPRDPVA